MEVVQPQQNLLVTLVLTGMLGFLASCNGDRSPEKTLKECLKITGYNFKGSCKIGDVYGDASITIDKDGKFCSVTYSALGMTATESGMLRNLKLNKKGGFKNNTFEIVGDWEVEGTEAQGAKFYFGIDSKGRPNTVICQIANNKFAHYDYLTLTDGNFLKIKEILFYSTDTSSISQFRKSIKNNENGASKPLTTKINAQSKDVIKEIDIQSLALFDECMLKMGELNALKVEIKTKIENFDNESTEVRANHEDVIASLLTAEQGFKGWMGNYEAPNYKKPLAEVGLLVVGQLENIETVKANIEKSIYDAKTLLGK